MAGLYAATPPLECLGVIASSAVNPAASEANGRDKMKITACDVSRAYFDVNAIRPVYVEIVEEDREPCDEAMCG